MTIWHLYIQKYSIIKETGQDKHKKLEANIKLLRNVLEGYLSKYPRFPF